MSSVSGIGGGAQSLYQFVQALSGSSPASSTSATAAPAATSAAQSISQAAQSVGQAAQSIGQAFRGHHHHHGALQQIQDTVTTALQAAQASGSNADPNTIIENAIAQVLGGGNAGASGAADNDGDGDASGTSTSPTINTQNFFQKLQAFGVTPQQFQQDLLLAMRDAQNGTVNTATAFQSFPVGSTLNVVG